MNIHRILVATDYSDGGRAAVARAGQLAARHRAELNILHATPDWGLFSHRTTPQQRHYEQVTGHAAVVMNSEVARVQSAFQLRARGEVQRGKASQAILRAVESIRPDLLVLGTQGEHAPRFAPSALGGTTLKVIPRAAVPVLLVRQAKLHPYEVALAAVSDTDDQASRIVRSTSELVPEGCCHVLRAYEVPYLERLLSCQLDDAELAVCDADARAYAMRTTQELARAAAPGAETHVHVQRGMPLPTILTEVTRYGPQLVGIGKHSHTPSESFHTPLGCIGVRLAYHCPVDVLLVP